MTRTQGWEFTGLLIMVGDQVVYVLTSGAPKIENVKSKKKPLGPFQNISSGDVIEAVDGL